MPEKLEEQQLWEALTEVFRKTFGRDTIQIGPETTAASIEEWDSLNHVQLILSVEGRFGVRFKAAEVAAFESVGDLVAAIMRHWKT